MRIDSAQRDRKSIGNFTFNAKGSLLGVRILVAGLAAEDYGEQGERPGVGNGDAELREVSGRNASSSAGGRRRARDFTLGEKRLENAAR